MHLTELIMILGAFSLAFGIVYLSISSSHKQKMAMLEAGIDPRDPDERGEGNPNKALRNAVLFILVPIGILIGRAVGPSFSLQPIHGSIIFAFIFGGIGFGILYFLQKREEEKKNS